MYLLTVSTYTVMPSSTRCNPKSNELSIVRDCPMDGAVSRAENFGKRSSPIARPRSAPTAAAHASSDMPRTRALASEIAVAEASRVYPSTTLSIWPRSAAREPVLESACKSASGHGHNWLGA